MKPLKLKKLLEFKDREQVKELLMLASGVKNEFEAKKILMGYITNSKWALHGFHDGPVLKGLIGLQLLDKKTGLILHIAVRHENQKQGLGRELIEMVKVKLKLKSIAAEVKTDVKVFFERLKFELIETSENLEGEKLFKFSKSYD